jgi:hypothetical protein
MRRVTLGLLAFAACTDAAPSSPTTTPDGGAPDTSVPSTCAPPTGSGTTHTTASADETWTAAASPHVVEANLAIDAGKTITVEPCAVVRLKSGAGFIVEGKLLAEGAADKPIRFEREGAQAWKTIEARKGAELRFAYVNVEGGGSESATFDIRGDQESAPQPIFFADHVTVNGSGSLGVLVREGGGFAPGSRDLVVSGSATFPVSIWGRATGTLPAGTYTGNGVDEIVLPAIGGRDDFKEDTTLAARGVPYRIGGPNGGKTLVVAGSGTPLLTIEPGVTLRFDKEVRLLVDTTGNAPAGAIRAQGTAAQPIVFESSADAPAAGDWVGIVIEGPPDPRNAIAHAKIRHAGGASQISSHGCPSPGVSSFANEGALLMIGGKPASAFVTNTTIEKSAGEGIVRGWTGEAVDLLPTNTFVEVARCNQTFPKPEVGVCPDPAPCPK